MRWLRGAGSVTAIATGTALAVAVTLVLAGCAPLSTADVAMATPTSSATTSTSAGLVVTGSGWDASGIQGTVPAPGSCHYRTVPGSANVLPDPRCTPGAVDRAVTQDSLSNTVCRRGDYTVALSSGALTRVRGLCRFSIAPHSGQVQAWTGRSGPSG